MNQGKLNRLFLTERDADSPLGVYFTGLAVRLLRTNQNLHSMIVVQPDRDRQEIGYMTFARKPVVVGVRESWRDYDDEDD